MTKGEKARFCALAASMVAPPDGALVADLRRGEFRSLLAEAVREWGVEGLLPAIMGEEGRGEELLSVLQGAYTRLFGHGEGERISLVESTYKPWTTDRGCKMVFSASKGLIMGDSALHMQELYRRSSLKVPEVYRSTPDHLALELEFLSLLYEYGSREQVERFIGDHLDWVPELKAEMEKVQPHPFYRDCVEMIGLFLRQEGAGEKGGEHGKKKVH